MFPIVLKTFGTIKEMASAGKRLAIFSKDEIENIYGLPSFNEAERNFFFTLDESETKEMESKNSIESRVHFILQLGYFKCKSLFFDVSFSEVREDVHYILKQYFPNAKTPRIMISRNTRIAQQSRILKLLNYKLFNSNTGEVLKVYLLKESGICVDPLYLFDKSLEFLNEHRIGLPGYSTFQDIIGQALTAEERRLQTVIGTSLPSSVNESLQKMLVSDGKKMYGITVLKKDSKGFNYKEVMNEVKKKLMSEVLFKAAQEIIPKLEISEQNVVHYAYLVDYYTADRLKELNYEIVRLYLLCYVFYRFEKINDNLVNSFIYRTNIFKKEAKQDSKNKVYDHKIEDNSQGYDEKIGQILDIFTDPEVLDSDVRAKAFTIVEKEKFPELKDHIAGKTFDEEEFRWNYYRSIAKTISKNLRPLARVLDFESENPNDPLIEALTFVKKTFNNKKSLKEIAEDKFPKEFIPSYLESYLYEEKEDSSKVLNVYQYEFLIYYQLERALECGRVFVNDSFHFKSLKKDLLEDWETNKEAILASLNNPILNIPIEEQLKKFKDEFNPLLLDVNQRIESGENKEITIKIIKPKKEKEDKAEAEKSDENTVVPAAPVSLENLRVSENDFRRLLSEESSISAVSEEKQAGIADENKTEEIREWILSYPKKDSEVDNPFYDQFPKVSLNQILRFVNEDCNFMRAFTHVKSRYSKSKADDDSILACITALATNFGIFQMSTMSDIGYDKLFSTLKNFIRLETLKNGNDILVNRIADLPIFKQWNLLENTLVSSQDGKKIQIRYNHIMARHSSKYFGTKKGIVSLSMIGNNLCLNTKVIPPNDHESHHLFDLSFNNTSEVQPFWHCGDTHSINHLNFALLPLMEREFTPHLKGINKKACSIKSFEDPSLYAGSLIVPDGQIHEKIIKDDWDSVQHIFASLLMKKTTQSVVVRKLSSHERSSKTQKALWEYDKILADMHTLKFINDPKRRQIIREALNRGEGYHQLTGKIGGVNGGKFIGTTELELEMTNECCRFIANCIIYYNALILSKIYEAQEKLENEAALEFIRRLSPIAWRHIILNGRYEFSTIPFDIDLDKIIANLVFDLEKSHTKSQAKS